MPTPSSAPRPAPSRRAVIGASAALPLSTLAVAANAVATDGSTETVRLCNLWLAREAEQMRLFRQQDEVEDTLFRHHRWSQLTPEARNVLPAAAPLRAIQAQLDDLFDLRQSLASRLPRSRATNREGVMLKFQVVSDELQIQDFLDIHGLLKSAVRDLAAIW